MHFVQEIHTISPWQDSARVFKALQRVMPFDNAAAFMKVDPRTALFRITWEQMESKSLIPKKVLNDFCLKHRFSP